MHRQLTEAQRVEFAALFRSYDLDGDGLLDRQEVRVALRATDPEISDQGIDTAMDALDEDGSGRVDLNEFLSAMAVFARVG